MTACAGASFTKNFWIMTKKQLEKRVRVSRGKGYNLYNVEIDYRGKQYQCTSNNSLAYDTVGDEDYGRRRDTYYTCKSALQAFYNECKRKNHIGEYKY